MSLIAPSVLAQTVEEYEQQIKLVSSFAERVHIDLADGELAPATIPVTEAFAPSGSIVDIHLMYHDPGGVLDEVIALQPHLVTIHSTAVDAQQVIEELQSRGIKAGVAITPSVNVDHVAGLITAADHILIFSGSLGHFGGTADLRLLEKVEEIRILNPDVEIGWDGGANADNVSRLAAGGIDVIVAGGAIHGASNPEQAFRALSSLVSD